MKNNDQEILSSKYKVNLYRRLTNFYGSDNNTSYPYIMWGYFDGMDYSPINNLQNFFIDNKSENSQVCSNFGEKYETHQLCLYSIKNNKPNFLENNNLFPPLLIMTEIKVNEDILLENVNKISKNDNHFPFLFIYNEIESRINSYLKELEDHCEKPLFNIYSSLGYSDFIIIFRSFSYQSVANVINSLRSRPYNLNNKNVPFLRSTYSHAGYNRYGLDQIDERQKYDISLRISLRRPVNLANIKNEVIDNIKLIEDINNYDVKTLFGKYDINIIIPQIKFKTYASLFTETNSILHPLSDFSKQFINYTNSQILLDFEQSTSELPIIPIISFNPLETDGIINKLPSYLQVALTRLIQQYYQIIHNETTEAPLLIEINSILRTFLDLIRDHVLNNNNPNKEVLNSIRIGIRMISEFMQSRVQVSRMFFEMPIYTIHFIESSTKVSMMYMTFVEQIEDVINKYENSINGIENWINFFTIMDYSINITSRELFPYSENRQLIPIHLSKASFADLPMNIIFLAHETSHYLRPQNIIGFNNVFTDIILKIIAQMISMKILFGESDLIINLVNEYPIDVINKMSEQLSSFLKNKVDTYNIYNCSNFLIFQELLILVIKDIFSFVDDDVEKQSENLSNSFLVFSSIIDKNTEENLVSDKNEIQSLINIINNKIFYGIENPSLNNLLKALLLKVELDTNNNDIKVSINNIRANWQKLLEVTHHRKFNLTTEWKDEIKRNIFPIIEQYLKHIVLSKDVDFLKYAAACFINENTEKNCDIIATRIIQEMNNDSAITKIHKYMNSVAILLKEARADYFMCKILDLKHDQYSNVINNYKEKMVNNSETDKINELTLRYLILGESFFNISKQSTEEIQDIWNAFICSMIVKYINDVCKNEWSQYIQIIIGNRLNIIRKYISSTLGKTEKFIQDIKLIETYWIYGIDLFSKKDKYV